jgi:hypothetical protein
MHTKILERNSIEMPRTTAILRLSRILFAALALILCFIPRAHAQYTTGTVEGSVFDPSGSVVPGADVKVRRLATNETKTVTTGAAGTYSLPALAPGFYEISAKAPGFQQTVVRIQVAASQTISQDVRLDISGDDRVVIVGSTAATADVADASLSTIFSSQESNDLPTNRNITDLTSLAPGVAPMYAPSGGGGLVKVGGAQTGLISANGGRPENTNVEFDFTDANDWEFGGFALGTQPQPDMVEQFNILTSNLSAQYGIKSNGQIEMITKSGGNNWHGQAYEYLQNNFFNATNPVSGTATRIDENNYGFSMGGPVQHDRTFLFGGWQQNKTIGGGFSDLALVPTQAARNTVTDTTVGFL